MKIAASSELTKSNHKSAKVEPNNEEPILYDKVRSSTSNKRFNQKSDGISGNAGCSQDETLIFTVAAQDNINSKLFSSEPSYLAEKEQEKTAPDT